MRPQQVVLALILLHVVAPAHAKEYGHYDLKQLVTLSESASGQHSATINFRHMDQVLDDLAVHAGSYPVRFDSADDARRAQLDVKEPPP